MTMKRILLAGAIVLAICGYVAAHQNPADTPATKEDIQRYLQIVHSKEMAEKMMDAMSKPLHQMVHEQYLKDKDKLPADFEARMNKRLDEYSKDLPWDEILDSMVPVYQKHLTKGDVDALVTFYSTPTGQKLMKEMPQILSESMQNMMPLMRRQIDTLNQRVQEDIAAMVKESGGKNGKTGAQTNN
jgi:hypothetical protein